MGQTVDARVVSVPVHHQARIVGHAATDLPPLHAAFLIPRHVSLRRNHKRQTAGYRRSVAHRFASLLTALLYSFPALDVPPSYAVQIVNQFPFPQPSHWRFSNPYQSSMPQTSRDERPYQGCHTHGASAPFVAVTFPANPRTRSASFGHGSSD